MAKPAQNESMVSGAAYPVAWRVLSALLFTVSRGSLAVITALVVLGFVFSPPLLVRVAIFLVLIPGLAAALIRQVFMVDVGIREGGLSVHRRGLFQRGRKIELEQGAIKRVAPWRIPLPGPGLSIFSGLGHERRHYALQTDNPTPLLNAAAPGDNPPPSSLAQAMLVYARARWAAGIARWYHLLFKFGLFGLLPVFVAFRLHQYIMYGGLFGQYYLHGLEPYLSTLVYYWVMILIYLVLYAAFWRGLLEVSALMTARFKPARAMAVRKWGEILVRVLYYGGIPAFIVWRSFG